MACCCTPPGGEGGIELVANLSLVCLWQWKRTWLCLAGGLTGFEVAKDLMKLDFSSPEEAPEEFRAVTFNAPPAKKGMRMPSLTALEIQTQGVLITLTPKKPQEHDGQSLSVLDRLGDAK